MHTLASGAAPLSALQLGSGQEQVGLVPPGKGNRGPECSPTKPYSLNHQVAVTDLGFGGATLGCLLCAW